MIRNSVPIMQDSAETRGGVKCRIPQRLPTTRVKTSYVRPKTPKVETTSITLPRPKSDNRPRDDSNPSRMTHVISPRNIRPERDSKSPIKRPSTIPKRVPNEMTNKPRQVIMVPVNGRLQGRNQSYKAINCLPDQETIKKCEDLEVRQGAYGLVDDLESMTSPSDRAMQLKIKWEGKIMQFESLKSELSGRQKELVGVYACLRDIHDKMSEVGQTPVLPPAEELRIMNISNLTPRQLLQLCSNSEEKSKETNVNQVPISIDVNKLYNMPSKLVANCEQTLIKRKEIIDWFDTLKKQEKGIPMSKLTKKLSEFTAENEMLHCNLMQVKTEFYNELNDVVGVIRKSMNDTVNMQLRAEELMYSISELNAKNEDLRKQVLNADHLKSHNNRYRIEELEKELKDEKCKKMMLRDRLTRADGQAKANLERATQLEATLEQARAQTRNLERTIQHLHEQNQQLQEDFEKELTKLTESIKDNTEQLEEIADAREKLQAEKEQLEKRIEELSAYYNESLENLKEEMDTNVLKLIESNEKYQLEITEKKKLEDKMSSLHSQLLESELKCKDLQKQVEDTEDLSSKFDVCQKELEKTQCDLNIAEHEIDDFKNRLSKQNEQIQELEQKYKVTKESEEKLKNELIAKENYVVELEEKMLAMEKQLQDNKSKMMCYQEELTKLKNQLNRLQEDFGDFDNINDLLEMVSEQKEKLMKVTRQHEELIDLLQNKDEELERQAKVMAMKEAQLEKKNDVIKMMSDKDNEQTNIIKLLRNGLEMRSHVDSDFQQKMEEKDTEIDKLITSLETRKQQIAEFEKIIMTLEDQTRKANVQISNLETIILSLEEQSRKDNLQKRKDQEKIAVLENKLHEYESIYTHNKRKQEMDTPSDNLDNLIKILENELGMPLEAHSNLEDRDYHWRKRSPSRERNKHDKHDRVDGEPPLYSEAETTAKTIIRNFGVHCLNANDENYAGDSLDRKKAITNMDFQKLIMPDINMKTFGTLPTNKESIKVAPSTYPKKNMSPKNLGLYSPIKTQDDKKYKMFKLAGHRL